MKTINERLDNLQNVLVEMKPSDALQVFFDGIQKARPEVDRVISAFKKAGIVKSVEPVKAHADVASGLVGVWVILNEDPGPEMLDDLWKKLGYNPGISRKQFGPVYVELMRQGYKVGSPWMRPKISVQIVYYALSGHKRPREEREAWRQLVKEHGKDKLARIIKSEW